MLKRISGAPHSACARQPSLPPAQASNRPPALRLLHQWMGSKWNAGEASARKSPLRHAVLGATIIACFSAQAAVPSSLASAQYAVFAADVSGDGCPDYLVKAPDTIALIPLDDGISIPVPIPSQNKPVLLLSSGSCQSFVSQQPTQAQVAGGSWQPAGYAALAGDVAGDGSGSLLVAPTSPAGSLAFNLTRSSADGSFSLLQTLSTQDFGIGSGAIISLEYANGDSRSDLVIRNGLRVTAAFAAGPDGRFISGTSDLIAITKLVWKGFTESLRSATPADALQLVSSQTRPIFANALGTPGANPAGFPGSIDRFSSFPHPNPM